MATGAADRKRYKRVHSVLDNWLMYLGISQTWDIRVSLVESLPRGDFAHIELETPYKRAYIRIARKPLDAANDADLHFYLVHEIAHVLLAPISRVCSDMFGAGGEVWDRWGRAEEEVADTIARVLLRMRFGKDGATHEEPI